MRYLIPALVLLWACDAEGPKPSAKKPPKPEPANGKTARVDGAELYKTHCSRCHGDNGDGKGVAAEFLFPKPRNFAQARFKIRTTASGQLPTDDDLLRTIRSGLPGSAMPSFSFLTDEEQKAIIGQLKTFAVVEGQSKNRFEMVGPGTPVKVGDEPAPDLARGKMLYEKMACFKCHGETGEGDGPSSPTLVDDDGYPAPPNNFTRGLFKGGSTARDVYLRFSTGMSGTPMPSFVDTLKEDERWALAHYVKSLVKPDARDVKYESFKKIPGTKIDRVPLDPNDPAWTGVAPTEIATLTLWQRLKTPGHVAVRVLYDGTHMGVCLEWPDDNPNGSMLAPQDFSDGAAVMFSLAKPIAPITMGDKEHPCNLWHWRFDRQLDLASFQDIDTRYPNNVNDGYFCDRNRYPPRMDQPRHIPQVAAPSLDKLWLSGWGAGNPASNPISHTTVQNLIAYGFGTLTAQPDAQQIVDGKGAWVAGKWRVVFKRVLTPAAKTDAVFKKGEDIWISCALWDGGAGDRDGQKSITFWQTLRLE